MIIGAGLLFSIWFWWGRPFESHRPWYDRIREDITALAHKRPRELSKGQWQFIVGRTLQLHANCGSTWHNVEPEWREEFATEFERRLAGPITLADIDWLWDEYARHTKCGQTYSDRFRPIRAKVIAEERHDITVD